MQWQMGLALASKFVDGDLRGQHSKRRKPIGLLFADAGRNARLR